MKDFNTDLKYSLECHDDEMINNFYKRIFTGIKNIEYCDWESKKELQRKGIDKIIHFESGNKFTLDEKKRRSTYPDIALEYEHVYKNGKVLPGWIIKTECDYIVYIKMNSGIIFLLPTLLLKTAWKKHGESWKKRYLCKPSLNENYKTWNVFVKDEDLLNAITNEMKQTITLPY